MGGNEMKRITVQRTGQRPLRFHGELIAEDSESMNNASPAYSGSPGRATHVRVYKTQQGKYVLGVRNATIWQGESDTYHGSVHDSAEELIGSLEGGTGEDYAHPGAAAEIAAQLGVAEDVA
jgi:hypothetical protein